MKKIIRPAIILILLIVITQPLFSKDIDHAIKIVYFNNEDTSYRIFSLPKNGYGFDILVNNKVLIHQPFIPAVQGDHPFATKAEAEKTAMLMLYKLKNFGMPPTVSITELDSLHIHH